MAVTSLISPAGVVLLRPAERTLPPVPQTIPLREQTPQPPQEPDIRRLTPAEERRLRVEEIARRNQQRVENELIQETDARLQQMRVTLDRIVALTQRAQNAELSDEERATLVQQARELAGQTEEALPIPNPFQRPEVVSLATIALRPEVLALADVARAPREANEDTQRLQVRALAAQNRIEQVRREILRPEERRPQPPGENTEPVLEERERLQSPADATRVANEIRAESRVNSGELFLTLANVLPQNALSLLIAT